MVTKVIKFSDMVMKSLKVKKSYNEAKKVLKFQLKFAVFPYVYNMRFNVTFW